MKNYLATHPMLKRMLLKRLFPGMILGGLALAFTHSMWGKDLVDRLTFKETSWFDGHALAQHLRLVSETHHLTSVPQNCIVLLIHDQADGSLDVTFVERNGKGCPVIKDQTLDLFHMHVDRFNKEITTNAGHEQIFTPL